MNVTDSTKLINRISGLMTYVRPLNKERGLTWEVDKSNDESQQVHAAVGIT